MISVEFFFFDVKVSIWADGYTHVGDGIWVNLVKSEQKLDVASWVLGSTLDFWVVFL